jgi:hypothetical protein
MEKIPALPELSAFPPSAESEKGGNFYRTLRFVTWEDTEHRRTLFWEPLGGVALGWDSLR